MTTFDALMALAVLLFAKHWVADGPLQTDFQAAHKGDVWSVAGYLHAGVHAALTGLCLIVWSAVAMAALPITFILGVVLVEAVVHFTIDWSKCWADRRTDWARRAVDEAGAPVLQVRKKYFFFAFLADQTLHSFTYVAIVYAVGVAMGAAL